MHNFLINSTVSDIFVESGLLISLWLYNKDCLDDISKSIQLKKLKIVYKKYLLRKLLVTKLSSYLIQNVVKMYRKKLHHVIQNEVIY